MLMLRYRPRAVTSKQAKMADHTSLTSPNTQDHTKPISPFLSSPRFFFRGFITKGHHHETETEPPQLSPTSILDSTKPLFSLGNPIWYDNLVPPKSPTTTFPGNKQQPWEKLESKDIGLAIIGSPNCDKPQENSTRPSTRMVMFGSQLKVQIPPLPPSPFSPTNSPQSTANSINNTRNSKLGSVSNSSNQTKDSPRFFSGCDHNTCVISHGHNSKTNIFDDFIVESYSGVSGKSPTLNHNNNKKKKNEYCYSFSDKSMNSKSSESFLSFCYTCKKKLGQEKDIYIYKGEKAFCSQACRCQEMLLDEKENSEFDGAY